MIEKKLSIFVDESGRFQYPDIGSRFYIVGLVLHDQSVDLSKALRGLDLRFRDMHLEKLCFHAGPLIRQEKVFAVMDRSFRYRIFAAMMAFARHVDFRYHCLVVDKKDVTSSDQIVKRLSEELSAFLSNARMTWGAVEDVKVYYDCGQSPVTNLLHGTFSAIPGLRVAPATCVKKLSKKFSHHHSSFIIPHSSFSPPPSPRPSCDASRRFGILCGDEGESRSHRDAGGCPRLKRWGQTCRFCY